MSAATLTERFTRCATASLSASLTVSATASQFIANRRAVYTYSGWSACGWRGAMIAQR
jgi:hypothetical protein